MQLSDGHSYEEIRQVVVDILIGKEAASYEVNQFVNLQTGVAEVFLRRSAQQLGGRPPPRPGPHDAELIRDVFWDLFRQGAITLGWNDSNPTWPFFRLSHFGERTLAAQSPFRFHDTASFISLVRSNVPDLAAETVPYLQEAIAAFYAGCHLASCVMLGVAAEAEFLRLVDVAVNNVTHGPKFSGAAKEAFIGRKIKRFHQSLETVLPTLPPSKEFENLGTNLSLIHSVLRVARNDAGHPSSAPVPDREQIYVLLQMFVPFVRQLMHLRKALT